MAAEGKMNSILGQGCKITGTMEITEGTVRIDGEFEGTVSCPETLVVGKDGRVKADIQVKHAIIGGTVLGNIEADDKLELQSGSRLEGDIRTKRLVIDEGVFFEGNCSMSPDKKPSEKFPGVKSGTVENKKEQDQPKKEEEQDKKKKGVWSR
ncbi:MAG: polymer-forming cytoskeletal protein [Candidatus Krumholzibacteriales bacterium]